MIYVVLGMHKSGTTLVAEVMHASGIPMVEEASGSDYDAGNKWERTATGELNKRLLDGFGVDSIDLNPVSRDVLSAPAAIDEARTIAAQASAASAARGFEDWGFKDPRTCFTWPLWEVALVPHRVIGVYRHYGPVADHHVKWAAGHHKKRRSWKSWVARRAVVRWIQHCQVVLDAVAESAEPALLLSYEHLMQSDEEFSRLERFLGRDLVDRRNPGMFRNRKPGRAGSRWTARRVRWSGEGDAEKLLGDLETERARQVEAGR